MDFRIVVLILTMAILGSCSKAAEPERRPNIVFCFADDWGRYASCYAKLDGRPNPSQVVKTPNIDAVAARGVRFRNAFVNAPSCTPCRSALLSGRYFFNTGRGAILNGAVWDESIPSFPLLLQRSGYQLGKIAKVWSPGTPVDAPIGGQKYAFQKAGMGFNDFSEVATQALAQGQTFEAVQKRLHNQVEGNFADFLQTRDRAKPFFFWFGPTNVHRKWVRGSGKALWSIDPDSLQGKLPPHLPDVPEVREDFADYLGEIQAYDASIGVLLRKLQEAGELDRTLFVISGDHGAPGFPGGKCNLYDFGVGVALVAAGPGIPPGTGGRIVDDFVNLMDLAPTFLDAGKVPHPVGLNGRSVWPQLTSSQSGQINAKRNWVITGRERHVADAREGNKPYPQRALRTSDFLFIRNYAPERDPMGSPGRVTATQTPSAEDLANTTYVAFADMDASPTKAWLVSHRHDPKWQWHYQYAFSKRPGIELYDLKTDPHQVKNVALDPKYAETVRDLGERLTRTLTEVGDPGVTEADCRFEKLPFTAPRDQPKKK